MKCYPNIKTMYLSCTIFSKSNIAYFFSMYKYCHMYIVLDILYKIINMYNCTVIFKIINLQIKINNFSIIQCVKFIF